jgi:hypothetical protein
MSAYDVWCTHCRVLPGKRCVMPSGRETTPHIVREQLAVAPRPEVKVRWMGPTYTTTCEDCGWTVHVDKNGVLNLHPDRAGTAWCASSYLLDMSPPGSDLHATSAGLPTLGRRR